MPEESQFYPCFHLVDEQGHEFSYDDFLDVIQHVSNHALPYDPEDPSDLKVFLAEELHNEHSDLELARYELYERKVNLAETLQAMELSLKQSINKTYGSWTLWYGVD